MKPRPVDDAVSMAVVGVIVPDEPRFHGAAFNRAAQMFQVELLRGMERAGLPATAVFSVEPIPGFPRSRRLFGKRGDETTASGLRVRLLPFVNVLALKSLTVGASVLLALLAWAWRHRHRERIIHVFNLTMPPGIAVWLAARLSGSRITVSVMDVWRPGAIVPDTLPWRVDFLVQRHLLPRLDGHMVVSPAIGDDFVPGRRVCVIEGGIAAERFPARPTAVESAPGRAPRRFRIVLSGSLEPYNGVDLAIDAMRSLPEDCELVIAGAGTLAQRAADAAAADDRIVWKGFLSFDEVLVLYASADLLLNARITQAMDTRYFFPSKLMELLASGTPVLSTCTGQVEAEYGDVLYLLREETPQALAVRILDIRANDLETRRTLGARARAFMLREKTWDRQGQRLADYMMREVLGRSPR